MRILNCFSGECRSNRDPETGSRVSFSVHSQQDSQPSDEERTGNHVSKSEPVTNNSQDDSILMSDISSNNNIRIVVPIMSSSSAAAKKPGFQNIARQIRACILVAFFLSTNNKQHAYYCSYFFMQFTERVIIFSRLLLFSSQESQ
jgi:hypothetical protein